MYQLSPCHPGCGLSTSASKVQNDVVVLGREVPVELLEVLEGFPIEVGVDLIHVGEVIASNPPVVGVAIQLTILELKHST